MNRSYLGRLLLGTFSSSEVAGEYQIRLAAGWEPPPRPRLREDTRIVCDRYYEGVELPGWIAVAHDDGSYDVRYDCGYIDVNVAWWRPRRAPPSVIELIFRTLAFVAVSCAVGYAAGPFLRPDLALIG